MNVAVVFESIYGNTRRIAEAIAAGAQEADPSAHVQVIEASKAGPESIQDVDLLVAGGPTHALRMSTPNSRKNAPIDASGGAHVGTGVREWLETLPQASSGARAAAFDTRLSFPLSGGAARTIARQMRGHGYRLAARPKGFIVKGSKGPLQSGEESAARSWGAALVKH